MVKPSIGKNLLLNWSGHGANLLAMFFLSPLILHHLGATLYGVWSLLTVIVGYLGLLDIGIRASTGRYINYYLAKNDHDSVLGTIKTSLAFYSYLSLLLLFFAYILGLMFPTIFSEVPLEYKEEIKIVLVILAFNLWVTAVSAIVSSVLSSHERFDYVQSVALSSLAFRVVLTLFVIHQGYELLGLAIVSLLTSIMSLFLNLLFAQKTYSELKIFPLSLDTERLRELLSFGVAAFLTSIAYMLINQSDLLIIGAFIGVADVAIYAFGGMLVLYSWGFVEQIGITTFPSMQRAAAKEDTKLLQFYVTRQIRYSLIFGVPLYVILLVMGDAFIVLWIGDEYAESAKILGILCVARILALFTVAMAPCLTSLGVPRYNVYLLISEATINVASSVFLVLVFDMGIYGVAVGTLIAVFSVRVIFYPILTMRLISYPLFQYLKEVFFPGALFLIAVICSAYALDNATNNYSWLQLIVNIAFEFGLSILLGYFLLNANERKELLAKFG